MSYYLSRTLSRDFNAVLEELTARLKDQGFGVLTDIDVQATMQAKLGATMRRYRILGACNPRLAFDAIQAEEHLGVLLPCNVIVRETEDRRVEVASIDPVATLARTGNESLGPMAEAVRSRLAAALAQLKD